MDLTGTMSFGASNTLAAPLWQDKIYNITKISVMGIKLNCI